MISSRSRMPLAVTALCAFTCVGALARQDDPKRGAAEKSTHDQRVEGVIVRVEPIGGESDRASRGSQRVKLTINTAAVWRDYVRDTATTQETSPEKAARKGNESVATKGQPKGRDTTVTIEVTPESHLDLRYRAAMDERSLGADSADEARRIASEDAKSAKASDDNGHSTSKKVQLNQVKPGLFVFVRYHRDGDQERADRVVILEPVRDQAGK